jgi:hypothetical protein
VVGARDYWGMRKYFAAIIHSHPARQRVVVWRFALAVYGAGFSFFPLSRSCFCSELLFIRLDYCLFSLYFDVRQVLKTRFSDGHAASSGSQNKKNRIRQMSRRINNSSLQNQ